MSNRRFVRRNRETMIMEGNNIYNFYFNKKVLLRERKRHTARHVASTRYAARVRGTPPSWDLTWMGVPPFQVGGTPFSGGGTPFPGRWGTGTPVDVWTDTQSETITFPHPSDAGGKNENIFQVVSSPSLHYVNGH